MAKTQHYLENRVYHKSGDNVSLGSSVDGTTLKLSAPQGFYDGAIDNVTITNSDFIVGNIKETANIFGKQGTIPVHTLEMTATLSTVDGTKLNFTPPEGYYSGFIQVSLEDENFTPFNIKDGVSIFGKVGTMIGGGDYELLATNSTFTMIDNDDGDTQRGRTFKTAKFVDNDDGTYTDTVTGLVWLVDFILFNNEGLTPETPKGTWKSGEDYAVGDVVDYSLSFDSWKPSQYSVGDIVYYYGGQNFICIQEHTSNDWGDKTPEESHDWEDYWEYFELPGTDSWKNGQSYNVGDIVMYTNYMYEEETGFFVCIEAHNSNWANSPIPDMGDPMGVQLNWAEINGVRACKVSHTSDLVDNHGMNDSLWGELPFCGSADNFTTHRKMNYATVVYLKDKLTYLGKDWVVPNIRELASIIDYGERNPATRLPGAITLSNSHYMSSTPYHDRYGYGEMSSIWGLNVVEGFTGGISLMSSHYVIFMENTE